MDSTRTRAEATAPERLGFGRLLRDAKEQARLEDVANGLGADLKPSGASPDKTTLRGYGVCHGGDNETALLVETGRGRWWCFRCNEGGDVLDLWQRAKGLTDKTDALVDLAATHGVEPTPRPEGFLEKQKRQRPVRDAIEKRRVEHVRDLLFSLVEMPWLRRLPPEVREEAAREAWDGCLPLARMLYESRRGA